MIHLMEGKDYLAVMECAANYAWANRSCLTSSVDEHFPKYLKRHWKSSRDTLSITFRKTLRRLRKRDVAGKCVRNLLMRRKGPTRAFIPHHPLIPISYQLTGQPVLIGGTTGTCCSVLAGTEIGAA
jgi:tRNA-splicing ligase RtcB (3'-phosphate/5'-hydroxy nucleic acid ligase)